MAPQRRRLSALLLSPPAARGWLAVALVTITSLACAPSVPAVTPGAATPSPRDAAEQRCRHEDPAACAELGRLLVDGGSSRERERGLVLLEVACGNGNHRSCAVLGRAYLAESRGPSTAARALALFGRACAAKVAEGCTGEGEALTRHLRVADRKARERFLVGCEMGDARGCELLGDEELSNRLDSGHPRAAMAFARACGLGRLSGCHQYALMSWRDPARRDEGARLLVDNCQRGFAASCLEVAMVAAPIVSAEPSCKLATALSGRACQLGAQQGCFVLDACVVATSGNSPGADQRRQVATGHLLEGCEQRDPLACVYWGDALQRQSPEAQDVETIREAYSDGCRARGAFAAVACARRAALDLVNADNADDATAEVDALDNACTEGVATACCAFADELDKGKWVVKDAAKAKELRRKVCPRDSANCCQPASADR